MPLDGELEGLMDAALLEDLRRIVGPDWVACLNTGEEKE